MLAKRKRRRIVDDSDDDEEQEEQEEEEEEEEEEEDKQEYEEEEEAAEKKKGTIKRQKSQHEKTQVIAKLCDLKIKLIKQQQFDDSAVCTSAIHYLEQELHL